MKKIFLITLLILFQILIAEDLRVDSYVNQNKIGISDLLKFTIEISGEQANRISEPQLPAINGFKNLGSSTSTSSSVSIINGRMQSEYTRKYTYTLQPLQTGKFIIPPVSISFGKQVYKTSTIQVEVIGGSTEPPPPPSTPLGNDRQINDDLSSNLFLVAEVDKKKVYLNEPVTVDFILYTRYDIANLAFGEEPRFNGFWKEEVFTPKQINFVRRNYQGVLFNSMLMKSVTLFATQSGELEIPSMELKVDIRIQPASFWDFGSTKQYMIKSRPIEITVMDIPADKPKDFINAVGRFSLKSSISQKELRVGDSFTYTLELEGEGNLKQINIPTLPPINHLRFLDPEIQTQINDDQKSGKKIIKYLVIAQSKGQLKIPAVTFSFFDTLNESYQTLRTDEYQIFVEEGSGIILSAGQAQLPITLEGKDIAFIIKDIDLKNRIILFNSFKYWFLFIVSLMLIPLSAIYGREIDKLSNNIDYLRQKRARRILKKYLKDATRHYLNRKTEFYTAVQTGLGSYLCDKLQINRGSSTEEIFQALQNYDYNEETIAILRELFEKCSRARFMPGGFSPQNIESDFALLKSMLPQLSAERIKK